MSLNVRKATNSDSKVLLELLEEARKHKLSLGDDAWGDYPFTEEDVALRLKSNGCYLAELNGVIIGSISLIWGDEHNWGKTGRDGQAGYIHGLMVGDKFRGRGLGEQMMDWAFQEIQKNGRKFARLDCHADNRPLCSYYENLGFQHIATKDNTAFYQLPI